MTGPKVPHVKVPASVERAERLEASGEHIDNKSVALLLLVDQGVHGMTMAEYMDMEEKSHQSASSALSELHKEGVIERLALKRGRCHVYVLPKHVKDRATVPHGSTLKTMQIEDLTEALRGMVETYSASGKKRRKAMARAVNVLAEYQ